MIRRVNAALGPSGHKVVNVNDLGTDASVLRRMAEVKILLNLHQTPLHRTIEEFRILPALLSGVVVVSEDGPLRRSIPYHQYIVWANYHALPDTVRNVSQTYNWWYTHIHGPHSGLRELSEMEVTAFRALSNATTRAVLGKLKRKPKPKPKWKQFWRSL